MNETTEEALLWNRPIKIWLKTSRVTEGVAQFFETPVRSPNDLDPWPTDPNARCLYLLQYPLQLIASLLLSAVESPLGNYRQFYGNLIFEQPKQVEEANILFLDVGVAATSEFCVKTWPLERPVSVQERIDQGERIIEETVTTPYCIISVFKTSSENVGATIALFYSSDVFDAQSELLKHKNTDSSDVRTSMFPLRKSVVEPKSLPQSRFKPQPEDSEFWKNVDIKSAKPLPEGLDAKSAREFPPFVAQLVPSWVEELRYLRELSYILAALLSVLLGTTRCSSFCRRVDNPCLALGSVAFEYWNAHLFGQYDLGREIHAAMARLKLEYRSRPGTREQSNASGFKATVFSSTQRRDWRFWQFARYFYLWKLFDTTQGVSDMRHRDLWLIGNADAKLGSFSPLMEAFLEDAKEAELS